MPRTWTINGRFLTQPITGVQRYGYEIVSALDRHLAEGHPLARDLELDICVPTDAPTPLDWHAIRSRPVGRLGGHAWEQAILPRFARHGLVSLCNTGPLLARRHIVCIHDLNTRSYPASYSIEFRALYRVLLPLLGRRATAIATVSRYSAGELTKYGVCTEDKTIVIPDGYEHATRWMPRHNDATRAASGRNTVVIIGSPAPHKNVGLIIAMADRLKSAGLRVAVAGLSDSRVFASADLHASADNIAWLGRLSDNELAALLLDSLCLAFPSFVEGFGLPALEAMTLGCPVVASDRASLPEICAEAALYASPTSADAWYSTFVRLHRDQDLRASLIARGKARAPHFSWRKSAELYLRAMAHADGMHGTDAER
jgi:glycosyltransferase involved in cell wall biosynthesis